MLKKFLLFLLILLLFAFYLPAQQPVAPYFSRVTKKEGLATNTVFQTLRDGQGFLWIASQNGLQRYDGHRFLSFRHSPGDSTTIPKNSVNHLFIDKKGRLWPVFDRQLGVFDTKSFKFRAARIISPVGVIKKMIGDDHGNIIMFADNKQFVYNEHENIFEIYKLPTLPQGYTVGDMAIDSVTGMYWFTGKLGSFIYDPKSKEINTKELGKTNSSTIDSFESIKNVRYPFIAKDSSWWFVNWLPFSAQAPVLFRFNRNKNELQSFEKIRPFKNDSYYEIWRVFQQANGRIWIYGMGLFAFYDEAQNRFVNISSSPFQKNGIDYDFVSNLYEDEEWNVWVCTNKGLYRFNTDAQVMQSITNMRPGDTASSAKSVSSVLQTKKNGLWVGTWGTGIFSYDSLLQPISNPVTNADPSGPILHAGAMIQRVNGEVWIGTHNGELRIYNAENGQYSTSAPAFLRGERINQLLEDKKGNIWIGTGSGMLLKCEKGNWRDTAHAFKIVLSDISDIMKLFIDSREQLWVCTASTGVYQLDPMSDKVVKQFKAGADKNEGLLNEGATDIVQYNDSIYLMASDALCILNYNTNKFRYLTAAEGLPAEHITTLVLDRQKRLWVGLDGGLYRLNLDNNLYLAFDAEDGIANDIFQVAATAGLRDGRIVMGTPHDFLVFDPERTTDKSEVPSVKITGLSLGNTVLLVDSVEQESALKLSHDDTFIRIELSTLNFRKDYYMYYMLEGLDKTWKLVNNNEIVYQYLPAGDYILKLKARNGDGVESRNTTSIKIEVTPPFWNTWWFYSFLALMIGGLLFWFDHERIKRKTAILQMRSNIADDLYQDINTALNNITILSEMAKKKADKEPEKSKEFIEQINAKSQSMSLAMDDILWSIDPNNDSMKNFMLRFREYIDSLKSQYNVQIDTLIDKKAESLQLKMKVRNDIFWLFKGGITNTVKTGASNCRIHITFDKPELIYTLEFDIAGMDIERLNNLRQRNELSEKLNALDARLEFVVHKTNAVFVLSIPVKGNDL